MNCRRTHSDQGQKQVTKGSDFSCCVVCSPVYFANNSIEVMGFSWLIPLVATTVNSGSCAFTLMSKLLQRSRSHNHYCCRDFW